MLNHLDDDIKKYSDLFERRLDIFKECRTDAEHQRMQEIFIRIYDVLKDLKQLKSTIEGR